MDCKPKWVPNGIVKREDWVGNGSYSSPYERIGEVAVASCVCEKCGEIKFKKEQKQNDEH